MRRLAIIIGLVLLASLLSAGYAWASPSENFTEKNGDVFDDWEICRTRAFGSDGFYQISDSTFRPVIAFESLGDNAAMAYQLGEQFAQDYADPIKRAEAIFSFVRDRVKYTTDIDQFGHDEFAQNADEMAAIIGGGRAGYGDCEDSAVLLAVMYKGAGYRSAIIVGEEHTACLVYLPDYTKAPVLFEINGEPGWVWAEATGKNNPLGWTSKEFLDVNLAAYEITSEAVAITGPPPQSEVAVSEGSSGNGSSGGGGSVFFIPLPFFGIIFLLWLVSSLFGRRRRRAR
jgi:predicted transglutaminase-like cysteine proteinase